MAPPTSSSGSLDSALTAVLPVAGGRGATLGVAGAVVALGAVVGGVAVAVGTVAVGVATVGEGVAVGVGRVSVIGVSAALQNVRPASGGRAWFVPTTGSKPLNEPSASCCESR